MAGVMQRIDNREYDDAPRGVVVPPERLLDASMYSPQTDRKRAGLEPALTPRVARIALILSDLGAIALGYIAAFTVQSVFRPVPGFVRADHLTLSLLSVPVWLIALVVTKSYVARHVDRATQEFSCILRSARIVVGIIIVASFLSQFDTLSRLWVVVMIAAVTSMLLVERGIARIIFHRLRVQGKMTRRVLIAGTGTDAISLLHSIKGDRSLGYDSWARKTSASAKVAESSGGMTTS
jgi:hypothetical protein